MRADHLTTLRLSVDITQEVREELRGAVEATGESQRAVVTRALIRHLADLRRKHNGGQPFPRRRRNLKPGRPATRARS